MVRIRVESLEFAVGDYGDKVRWKSKLQAVQCVAVLIYIGGIEDRTCLQGKLQLIRGAGTVPEVCVGGCGAGSWTYRLSG